MVEGEAEEKPEKEKIMVVAKGEAEEEPEGEEIMVVTEGEVEEEPKGEEKAERGRSQGRGGRRNVAQY